MTDFMKKKSGNYGSGRKPYINPQFNQPPQFRSQDNKPNGNKKKDHHRKNTDAISNLMTEALPQVKQMMESIAREQTRRADAEDRKAVALETIALHVINALQHLGVPQIIPEIPKPVASKSSDSKSAAQKTAAPEPDKQKPEKQQAGKQQANKLKTGQAQPASGKKPKKNAAPAKSAKKPEQHQKTEDTGRQEVIETILNMRQSGSTFGQIAKYLEGRDIPTFSGKGKWHAQTIHRLFQTDKILKDSVQDNK